MNRMADGVLKDMAEIQKKEDDMINRYMKEFDSKTQAAEQAKAKKRADIQANINATLAKQQKHKEKVAKEMKDHFN